MAQISFKKISRAESRRIDEPGLYLVSDSWDDYSFRTTFGLIYIDKVLPDVLPPTNIHVIIGRNGVGKTRLLNSISTLLRNRPDAAAPYDLGNLNFFSTNLDEEDAGFDGSSDPLEDGFSKRCPLCTQRDVQTLDHYLPESVFPEFAVFPLNLVPTCFSCNKAKLAHVPTGYDEQLFHPYFDDWGDYQFLTATIDVNSAVDASFSVSCPEEVDWQRFLRVQFHFQQLNLNELYSEHAALELVQKREVFAQTFASGGSQALKEELELEANARSVPFINSWQPALYRALSESDPFCSGGFLYIES